MIGAIDRENGITVNKISVPLKTSTAKAAEVARAFMVTDVLGLMFGFEKKRGRGNSTN